MTDTTSNTHSNYPFAFSFNSTTVDRCKVIGDLTVAMGALNSTNFDSGGYGESIPDGLLITSPFTLEVLVDTGEYEAMLDDMEAKTIAACVLTHAPGSATFTVNGWYKQVVLKGGDAEKPDLVKVIVTVQPTGAYTAVS